MGEKTFHILLTALVSGTVSFGVAWISGAALHSRTPENLKVRTLDVVDAITIKSPENGEELLVLRNDGVIYAKNKIVTEHFLGKQFSGHIFAGNRVLVSPNDLVNSPVEKLEFMGELGISPETGSGELLIRSPHGGNRVGTGVNGGQFAKIGFDQNDLLHFLVFNNASKECRFFANQEPSEIAPPSLPQSSELPSLEIAPQGNGLQEPLVERSQSGPPVAGEMQQHRSNGSVR